MLTSNGTYYSQPVARMRANTGDTSRITGAVQTLLRPPIIDDQAARVSYRPDRNCHPFKHERSY